MTKKMQKMIREVLLQAILVLLLMIVIYGNHDSNVYYQNQQLRNTYSEPVKGVSGEVFLM